MKIFKEYRQGQNFLFPPSLDEFVPEDHEVRIISDVVDTLDASLLLGRYEGGGAQPVKTRYGWLMITHGVDYRRVYRLGVLLLDLVDPTVVIYRSPNAILEPKEKYEEGEPGRDWVPNVVFTCGAVPREDGKDMLGAEDELLVYYGAADSAICVATARVGDLIPSEYLNDSP